MFIAGVGRVSLPDVDCSADVRLEVWWRRGATAEWMSIFRSEADESWNKGKVESSKSDSRRAEST